MTIYDELVNAGLPVIFADESGNISMGVMTDEQQAQFDDILLSYFQPDEYLKKIRYLSSEDRAGNIPNWATWTETEALDWGDTNIGTPLTEGRNNLPATLTLATTRLAILAILDILDAMWAFQRAAIRMLIALRDKNWPNLGA